MSYETIPHEIFEDVFDTWLPLQKRVWEQVIAEGKRSKRFFIDRDRHCPGHTRVVAYVIYGDVHKPDQPASS